MLGLRAPQDPGLLIAALAVCAVACFGVYRIRARVALAQGRVRDVWLFLAGVEAGAGIWGAQMLATLAFDPGLRVGFEPLGALGALLLGVVGATLAFAMSWTTTERLRQGTGAAVLGLTAAGVHFFGLGAEKLAGRLHWEPVTVWVSVVVCAALCTASVLAAGRARSLRAQVVGAALLWAAIIAQHIVGNTAVTLTPASDLHLPPGLLNHPAMVFVAALVSTLTIAAAMGAAYIDDESSRRATARMQRLADATREGIAVLDTDRCVVDCNAAFAGLCGLTHAEVRGRPIWSLVALDEGGDGRLDQRQDAHMLAADGARVPIAVKLNFVAEGQEGRPGLIATVTDLREQRAAEARIRFLNEHDPVSGLPNRAVMVARLEQALAEVRSSDTSSLILVNVRVTNSQEVNSLHGHAAGDALLAKVGERLRRIVGEVGVAARLGGNEFAFFVIGDRRQDQDSGAVFFTKVANVLRRAFVWNAQAIEPLVRIGVAASPQDSSTVAELMLHAESAQQAREAETADGVSYFRKDLHDELAARRSLAQDLRRAISNDELTVFYQPQARSEDGSLCGFEALVRWSHPELGFLSPDRFIGVAEEYGLVGELGEWVLQRACSDATTWPRPVSVAVNLSPLQVGEADLPKRVHEILLQTGLSPGRLELEITESALFRDYQRALDVLRRLKALGIRIAMDDFGTGFSSLSTLQSFPFDKIKIDKSFVEGVGKLERSTVIVKAVLGIGRGLAIPVVAEGVETEEQLAFLRDELCATVQGYLIGKPGPIHLHQAMFAQLPTGAVGSRRAAAA